MICSSCKTENIDGAQFCVTCGKSMAVATAPADASPRTTCPKCNTENAQAARFCVSCGSDIAAKATGMPPAQQAQRPAAPPNKAKLIYPRNPPLSPHLCWLGLLIAGLPQLIYGQIGKGVVMFLAWFFLLGLVDDIPAFLAACLVSIIDGYKVGKALQQGRALTRWQFFP